MCHMATSSPVRSHVPSRVRRSWLGERRCRASVSDVNRTSVRADNSFIQGAAALRRGLHFPAFEAWNARTRRKMESERRNPFKRSLLWMAAAYVILPLALVIGFLALLVHLGVR